MSYKSYDQQMRGSGWAVPPPSGANKRTYKKATSKMRRLDFKLLGEDATKSRRFRSGISY